MSSPKPMLIGGRDVTSDQAIRSINPANGAVNFEICAASPALIDQAVQVAASASKARAWRDMVSHRRAALLFRLADLIAKEAETLARLQMIENGKPWRECCAQAQSAAATFRYYGAVCETSTSDLTPARGNHLSMVVHEPYGVVAAITPWNSPLTMEAQKVAPALAAGNAVVLKPSELTSSSALVLGRLALEAGFPEGLLNVVPGTGDKAGAALVSHQGVRMVSFTGGTRSGRQIAAVAAQRLVPAALELGGKSPHIVFADANLDAAVEAVAEGIFEGSGQSCVAGSRLFLQRTIHDRFLDSLLARTQAIRVGAPEAPDTTMGPIASFHHRRQIESMVDEARDRGARPLTGGCRPPSPGLESGAYYLPTVMIDIDPKDPLVQQEIFGPVLCVLPFDDEADLVAQANDSVYGLAAGIWTRDFARAWRVARALEAGTVWINTYKQLSISTPFGGFKESGLGREKGASGMRLYQQSKSIFVGLSD